MTRTGDQNTTSNLTVGCAGGAAKGGYMVSFPPTEAWVPQAAASRSGSERKEVGRAGFYALIAGTRVVTIAKRNWPWMERRIDVER